MNRIFQTLILSSLCLIGLSRADDAPRVVQRKTATLHRPTTSVGNQHTVTWRSFTLSDDGTQIAGVGNQENSQKGLFGDTLHKKVSILAVWTLKTGKCVRAAESTTVLSSVAFAPDARSLVSWGMEYEVVPSNGKTALVYWDFGKPHAQSLLADLGKPQVVVGCGFTGSGKSLSLIAVSPSVTQSLAYKFAPPNLKPKPKVEIVVYPTEATNLPRPDGALTTEPGIVSRNGSRLAVSTGRSMRFIDVASGKAISTSAAPIGNYAVRPPLAISQDGSRVAFGVQPASAEEPGTIVIADGQSGATIATCRGHKSFIVDLAMTQDGKRLASTSTDKTARVWDVATGRELATITGLTSGATAVAITPDGQQIVTGAVGGDVEVWSVSTPGSKPPMPADLANLKGDATPLPPTTKQDFKSPVLTQPQETLYLAYSARRLIDRAAQLSDYPPDSAEVQTLISDARILETQARTAGADAATINGLASIPSLLKSLTNESAIRQRALRENAQQMREILAAQQETEASMQLGWFVGIMSATIGDLPLYSQQYDPITRTMRLTETGSLSPALTDLGMSTAMNSLFGGITLKAQLSEAEALGSEVLRRVTLNSLQRQAGAIAASRDPVNVVLAQRLGGTPLTELPVNASEKTSKSVKEFEAALTAAKERATQLKRELGQIEPFSAADVIAMQSLVAVPREKRATEWLTLASEMMALTHHIPAGAAYDRDRAVILGMSADLVVRAKAIERGSASWTKIPVPTSLPALAWLNDALRFDSQDRTGELREQKAWALCEYGRFRDGYLLAQELKPLRGHSPRFRFQLARAAHCVGRSDESLEELAIAIERLGLSDLKTVRACPDLPKAAPRFRELTTIQLEAVCETALRGGKARIVNRSSFPLTNARFEMTFPTGRGNGTSKIFVAYLPPGEMCLIPYSDQFNRKQGLIGNAPQNNGQVKLLSSDQGTAQATVK